MCMQWLMCWRRNSVSMCVGTWKTKKNGKVNFINFIFMINGIIYGDRKNHYIQYVLYDDCTRCTIFEHRIIWRLRDKQYFGMCVCVCDAYLVGFCGYCLYLLCAYKTDNYSLGINMFTVIRREFLFVVEIYNLGFGKLQFIKDLQLSTVFFSIFYVLYNRIRWRFREFNQEGLLPNDLPEILRNMNLGDDHQNELNQQNLIIARFNWKVSFRLYFCTIFGYF